MPKTSKVGKFRAAAKASSRNVKEAPLTAQYLSQKKNESDVTDKATTDDTTTTTSAGTENAPLSRGQRKRLAKREQYLKREKMVMSSLRLQRLEEQKGKLDGLDAIREALGEAAAVSSSSSKSLMAAAKELSKASSKQQQQQQQHISSCNTNKSKKALANNEISHMNLVLQHPSFQSNPFAAIQTHLKNSLVDDAQRLKVESDKRSEEEKVMQVKKKEERKERIRDAKFNKTRKGYNNKSNHRAKRN